MFFVITLFLGALNPISAQETPQESHKFSKTMGGCPIISPMISFKVNINDATYDNTYDNIKMKEESKALSFGKIAGHVESNINVKILPYTKTTIDNKCILFPKLEIIVTSSPILRILNNYKIGSCEHDIIKSHEEKHIKMIEKFLKNLPDNYNNYIHNKFSKFGSIPVSESKFLKHSLSVIAQEFVMKLNRDQKTLHVKYIDNRNVKSAERSKCKYW
jgi:hypothetical protein